MPKKLTDLVTEAKAKYEETVRKAELEVRIASLLSAELPEPYMIYSHGYKADGGVAYKASVHDVAGFLELLPPVPMVLHHDSSKSIQPEERADTKHGTNTPISDFKVDVDRTYGYSTRVEVEWVTRLGDMLIDVKIELTDPHAVAAIKGRVTMHYGHHSVEDVSLESNLVGGQRIKWWADPSTYNNFTLYWARGVEWRQVYG